MGKTETELRREAQTQREHMGTTLEAIGDRVSPERMVERRKAAIGQRVRSVRDSVMGSRDYEEPFTTRMREQAGNAVGTAAERVQHAPEMVSQQTRGNPLAAGLVAFGAGMLLATIFPETETEQHLVQAAQPQMQHATEQLKESGRELAQEAKQHGQELTQEMKSAGSDAAGAVKEQAQSSAQQVRQDLQR